MPSSRARWVNTSRSSRAARRLSASSSRPITTLAPRADIRTVAVAGDHTSLALKSAVVQHLRGRGLAAHDLGTLTPDPVDYPDTAALVEASMPCDSAMP